MNHPCPWTTGELMALYAIAHCRGNAALAAKLLAHADQHREDTDRCLTPTSQRRV